MSKSQWHELFSIIHRISTWVEDGNELVRRKLEQEVRDYVVGASEVCLLTFKSLWGERNGFYSRYYW